MTLIFLAKDKMMVEVLEPQLSWVKVPGGKVWEGREEEETLALFHKESHGTSVHVSLTVQSYLEGNEAGKLQSCSLPVDL